MYLILCIAKKMAYLSHNYFVEMWNFGNKKSIFNCNYKLFYAPLRCGRKLVVFIFS